MKVEILLRDVPFHIEDFFREEEINPVPPADPLAEVEIWNQAGMDGVMIFKDQFEGETCYRVQHQNVDGLVKFLRALWKWEQG